MGDTITTILQTYKRPKYLQSQIDAIKNQSMQSDDIIIVQNGEETNFNYPDDIHTIKSSENMKFHLRFAIGLLAKTKYVCFFDDDTIPGQNWYWNCVNTIQQTNAICVGNGRIIDINKKTWYGSGWGNPSNNITPVDFGGHVWFLKTEQLKYMWFDKIYNYNNGEDIQLSANANIFGNIKTVVPPHPKDDKSLWSSLKGIEYGADDVASYKVNPIHFAERFALIEEYVKKGWNLLIEHAPIS